MKKLLTFVLVVCLTLALVAMVGCDKRDPLEKFYDEMIEEECFRVDMTVVVYGQTIVQTMIVDGRAIHNLESELSNESYTVENNDGVEEYAKDVFGKWIKSNYVPTDDGEYDVFDKEMDALFDPSNFNIDENKYTQKEDVEFESFKDVKITIKKDKCVINMTMTQDGISFDAELEISEIGEVSTKLPKEYITIEIPKVSNDAWNALQDNGFSVRKITVKSQTDMILKNLGISGAKADSILVASKDEKSVILIYCPDSESAKTAYEGLMEIYSSSYEEIVNTFGKDSEEYKKFCEVSKDEIIGRDGNVVCMASSIEDLDKAK